MVLRRSVYVPNSYEFDKEVSINYDRNLCKAWLTDTNVHFLNEKMI